MPHLTATDEIQILGAHGGAKPPAGSGGGGDDSGRGGSPSANPQRIYVTGITIAMGGILMFFMALVSAFIVRKGLGGDWLPFTMPRILWLDTAILLASSGTLIQARRLFKCGDQQGFRHWWLVTTVLGLLFLVGQLVAWRQMVSAGFYLASNASNSFFYVLTAAHGLHLLGGIAALLFVGWGRLRKLTLSTGTEIVSYYWHFLDGLWVFLFLLLLLGR
ncbi:MAG TPA: cytochrome c oxidase subunit 3 [Candidatus Acidoferrales bacterium]|nr:cytochrome c oxidase subunit 3 [Candidatus Acidoferrales bacterium]